MPAETGETGRSLLLGREGACFQGCSLGAMIKVGWAAGGLAGVWKLSAETDVPVGASLTSSHREAEGQRNSLLYICSF